MATLRKCPNKCLYALNSQLMRSKDREWGTESTVKITAGVHQQEITYGSLYLKVLISYITIDSRSTVTYIRATQSDLDKLLIRS